MAEQETLGRLIKRRMNDLDIKNVSELARRLGYSRSYVGHLVNDTSNNKRGTYMPEPEVVHRLAAALTVPQAEILRAINYLSPKDNRNPIDEMREAAVSLFGNGHDLSDEDWEEIMTVTRTLIDQKEKRNRSSK